MVGDLGEEDSRKRQEAMWCQCLVVVRQVVVKISSCDDDDDDDDGVMMDAMSFGLWRENYI